MCALLNYHQHASEKLAQLRPMLHELNRVARLVLWTSAQSMRPPIAGLCSQSLDICVPIER